jgi:hypothetical protein
MPAEEVDEAAQKDDGTDDPCGDARYEDRCGRDVQTRADARFGRFVQTPVERFDGAVEELCREYHADATHQNAPLQRLATEDHAGRDDEGGKEEVNEKAGMSADPQFEPAESIAELIAPRAARPTEDGVPGALY